MRQNMSPRIDRACNTESARVFRDEASSGASAPPNSISGLSAVVIVIGSKSLLCFRHGSIGVTIWEGVHQAEMLWSVLALAQFGGLVN